MTWLERMNKVLDYIEANLDGEINIGKMATLAACSTVNLQRVFSVIADLPLSEYIRRRRLTQAAFELQNSSIRVLDLALKYGYDSPESFARAFNVIHGCTPSAARREGAVLTAYPRISFLLTLKGAVPMNYKIEKKDAFRVYGIEGHFSPVNGENFATIPQFWSAIMEDGRYEQLKKSTGLTPEDQGEICLINAVCDYEEMDNGLFPYMIFAFETEKSELDGYKAVEIPASTWAIFRTENHRIEETSQKLQSLIQRIYTDWLPTANYDKVDGYEVEMYYGYGDACWSEFWIRVESQ